MILTLQLQLHINNYHIRFYFTILLFHTHLFIFKKMSETIRMFHLAISTAKTEFPYQVRYPATMALVEFKIKLELVVGIYAQDMKLELRSAEGKFLAELFGDDRTLEELGVKDNSALFVHDMSSANGAANTTDASGQQQPFYVMPDEKYESRKESARKWKQDLLATKANALGHSPALPPEHSQIPLPSSIQVGHRCIVHSNKQQSRRMARIVYVGPTHFGARAGTDIWVGVVYEEPVGKNDGSLDGHRYFECAPNYGGFVQPRSVEVLEEDGYFPGEELANKAEMEIEEI